MKGKRNWEPHGSTRKANDLLGPGLWFLLDQPHAARYWPPDFLPFSLAWPSKLQASLEPGTQLGPWFLLLAFVIAPSTGRFSFGEDMSSILLEETV